MIDQHKPQPQSPTLRHINRGAILHVNGDLEGAREQYEQALSLEPANATALNNLGFVLAQQGQLSEAMQCYERAIALAPERSTAYSNLGNAYALLADYERALQLQREAIKRDPANLTALDNLAQLLMRAGQYAEAAAAWQQYLHQQPADARILTSLAIVQAAQGRLDDSFNPPDGFLLLESPIGGQAVGVETAVQPDGRIVVAGYANDGTKTVILVLRRLPDGSPDESFGQAGHVLFEMSTDQRALGLALGPDGSIYVAGYVRLDGFRDILVLKFQPSGELDRTHVHSSPGTFTDIAFGLAVQADGRVLVVGEHSNGSDQDLVVLRLDADLVPDPTFGQNGLVTFNGGGQDKGFAVAVDDNGRIVAVGAHVPQGQTKENLLVLGLTADGRLDPDFATNGVFTYGLEGDNSDYANFVDLQPDGRIVVAGSAHDGQAFKIVLLRLHADGALDTGFGDQGVVVFRDSAAVFDYAYGVAVQNNGRIVLAGVSNDGVADKAVVLRFESNGSLDTGFGNQGTFVFSGPGPGPDRAHGLDIQKDGNIVVTGYANDGQANEILVFRLR
ncbi:MAG: tetratricopeptide repeat protein [Deltaproteobacteria bacterium]|nr:tetratricopeptide repeat protein [Deltaproteobacteria bacterium]